MDIKSQIKSEKRKDPKNPCNIINILQGMQYF